MNNTGGPAFPTEMSDGMTLRDYFAAKAVQAFLACPATTTRNENMYAFDAYTMADAMLKAREA
tara:strand:- start:2681 stop:2869 length:189 start_codon:yes stop_codon:yes gene_type:complete